MSFRYNPCRDTFEHIPDKQTITVNYSFPQFQTVRYAELSQECIEQIACAVVQKLKNVTVTNVGNIPVKEVDDGT